MVARNLVTFGNPLGRASSEEVTVSTADPGPLLENGAKNLLLNADTLSPRLNQRLQNLALSIGRPFGLDRPNPKTDLGQWPSLGGTPSEDSSGSLIAMLAGLLSAGALLSRSVRERLRMHELWPVFVASTTGLLLLTVGLRWQLYGGRFQLMAVIPGLTWVAAVLSALPRRLLYVTTCLLVLFSVLLLRMSILYDISKPIGSAGVGYLDETRNDQMLRWCPGAQTPYVTAAKKALASGQRELGYVSMADASFTYPIWAILSQQAHGAPVSVVPVGIDNASGRDARSDSEEPRVALVLAPTKDSLPSMALPLTKRGYELQSVTPGGCEFVGLYERPASSR